MKVNPSRNPTPYPNPGQLKKETTMLKHLFAATIAALALNANAATACIQPNSTSTVVILPGAATSTPAAKPNCNQEPADTKQVPKADPNAKLKAEVKELKADVLRLQANQASPIRETATQAPAVTLAPVKVTGKASRYKCDAFGNCTRTEEIGKATCRNQIRGETMETYVFPQGMTDQQAEELCLALGEKFKAGLQAKGDEALRQIQAASGIAPVIQPMAYNPPSSEVASTPQQESGKDTCQAKGPDGAIHITGKADGKAACAAVNNAYAAKRGWIPAN